MGMLLIYRCEDPGYLAKGLSDLLVQLGKRRVVLAVSIGDEKRAGLRGPCQERLSEC